MLYVFLLVALSVAVSWPLGKMAAWAMNDPVAGRGFRHAAERLFVKVGGKFIALKSINEDISAASGAIAKLGGEIETVKDYAIPNGDARRLAVIKKISQTPTKYPRNSGNIAKKPL